MQTITDPIKFRENVKEKLFDILKDKKRSTNLEKGIYNYSVRYADTHKLVKKWESKYFTHIYISHLRTIITNIKNNEKLKAHPKPQEIAFMTHQEMNPKKWKALIEAKKMRDQEKYAPKMDANTDNFECRKCKSNRCSYYQLQTRSADEPMTTFVTCIDCGNRWKY